MGKNAYFELVTCQDGVYVEIIPPQEDGKLLAVTEITAYLDSHGLDKYDLKKIKEAAEQTEEKRKIRVGEPGSIGKLDETMELFVFQDKMHATARFYPPANGGKTLTLEDIAARLGKEKIKAGISQKQILSFLGERRYATDYVIAQGKEPVEGHDAKIQYFFNTNTNLRPKRNEDGTVNYKDLNTIGHVEKGQKIAELIPEDPGKPGINVYGEEIRPHAVKGNKLSYGNNITISEDKRELYSDVTGHASLVGGKMFVSDVYEVPADVDNSTGNIEYSGSVTVRGNVKGGFRISAKGDIVVEGIVEDAELYAGGQIIVKRGIHGMGKGVLQAGGNVLCKFIENAKVISGGYVDSEAILHSQVDAYSDVIVDGKKGFITGGIIRAGNLVSAKTIGSAMETITQIEVGADPLEKERYVELQKQIRTYNEQIDRIKPIVTTYSEKLKHGEHLSQEQLTYVRKLAEQLKQLKGAAEPLKAEAAKINGILALGSSARVKVANTIYSGVTIVISDTRMTLKNERTYSQFIRQDGEIKIIPL